MIPHPNRHHYFIPKAFAFQKYIQHNSSIREDPAVPVASTESIAWVRISGSTLTKSHFISLSGSVHQHRPSCPRPEDILITACSRCNHTNSSLEASSLISGTQRIRLTSNLSKQRPLNRPPDKIAPDYGGACCQKSRLAMTSSPLSSSYAYNILSIVSSCEIH